MINCPVCAKKGKSLNLIDYEIDKNAFFKLTHCNNCNLFYNSKFNNNRINYKNLSLESFFNSRLFKDSQSDLVARLKVVLQKSKLKFNFLDFGCGDGFFLKLVKVKLNKNVKSILGYDIGKRLPRNDFFTSDFKILKEYINRGDYPLFVICRHTLEHLVNIEIFSNLFEKKKNVIFLLETPFGYNSIVNYKYEDLVYPHVSYFSRESFYKIFKKLKSQIFDIGTLLNNENLFALGFKGDRKIAKIFTSTKLEMINKGYEKFEKKNNKLSKLLIHSHVGFWGVGGRCMTILKQVSKKSKLEFQCHLIDSDKTKAKFKIDGFKNLVSTPSAQVLKKIKIVVIGTRVGKSSILNEINSFKNLKKNLKVINYDSL